MRWIAMAWGLIGASLLAAAFYLAHEAEMPAGAQALGILFLDMGPLEKLSLMLIVVAGIAVLFAGASAVNRKPPPSRDSFLSLGALGLPALGLLAAARRGLVIHQAVLATHTTNFKIIAPSLAEAVLVAAVGVMAGAIAAALAAAVELRARAADIA